MSRLLRWQPPHVMRDVTTRMKVCRFAHYAIRLPDLPDLRAPLRPPTLCGSIVAFWGSTLANAGHMMVVLCTSTHVFAPPPPPPAPHGWSCVFVCLCAACHPFSAWLDKGAHHAPGYASQEATRPRFASESPKPTSQPQIFVDPTRGDDSESATLCVQCPVVYGLWSMPSAQCIAQFIVPTLGFLQCVRASARVPTHEL